MFCIVIVGHLVNFYQLLMSFKPIVAYYYYFFFKYHKLLCIILTYIIVRSNIYN